MKRSLLCLLLAFALAGCDAAGPAQAAAAAAAVPSAAPAPTSAPTPAPKTGSGVDKAETVWVEAAADGTAQKTTVEVTLKNPGTGRTWTDVSRLKNIKNTEGGEEYTRQGTLLTWQNLGGDIQYEGESDDALPVTVDLSCTLDGKTATPQALAGQSGHVTLRFDYHNTAAATETVDGQEVTVQTPFTALTTLVLPEDVFYNVEVENGQATSLGGQTLVVGYACPGLAESLLLSGYEPTEEVEIPGYVEVSADVVDFALDFTATIVTPGIFSDLEEEDLDELDDAADDAAELTDATGELADGTQELADGAAALADGLSQYAAGVKELSDGIDQLSEGLDTLDSQKGQLSDGVGQLSDGLGQLTANNDDLNTGAAALADAVLAGANAQLAPLLQQLVATPESAAALTWENYAATLEAAAAMFPDGDDPTRAALLEAKEQLDAVAGFVAGVQAYTGGVAAVEEGARALGTGVGALNAGIGRLAEGGSALKEGAGQLEEATGQLVSGAAALRDGTGTLKDGVDEFDREAAKELSRLAGDSLTSLARRLRALKQADAAYTNFSGLADGQTSSVRFIIETAEIT